MLPLVFAALLFISPCLCLPSPELSIVESKKDVFLSAPSFAVVGASDDETKFGTIFVPESQGVPCLDSLAEIADPARTSISIVTQPSVTLQILREATALGIFAVWLQPGAEDAAVLEFIANSNATATTYIHSAAPALRGRATPVSDTSSPCNRGNQTPDLISTLERRG